LFKAGLVPGWHPIIILFARFEPVIIVILSEKVNLDRGEDASSPKQVKQLVRLCKKVLLWGQNFVPANQ
jgi:hypothetical protein